MQRTAEIETEQTAPAKRGRKKKVRTVRTEEFEAPVEDVIETTAKPVEDNQSDSPEFDEIESLLDSLDAEDAENYTIRIDRLPNFRKTGQWGARTTNAEYCGVIPATNDYLEITRAIYGPGDYRFVLYDGGKYMRRWQRSIAEQPALGATPVAVPGPGGMKNYFIRQNGQQQTPEPQSLSDRMKEVADLFQQVKTIQDVISPQQPTTQAATAIEAPTIQDRIKEKVVDIALNKIIDGGDPNTTERVLALALGHDTSPGWGEIARDVVTALAPIATQLAGVLLSRAMGQQTATIQQQQSGGVESMQVPLSLPSSEAVAPQPISSWTRLCRSIIVAFNNGWSLDIVCQIIEEHAERHEEDRPKLQQLVEAPAAIASSGVIVAAGASTEFLTANPSFVNHITAIQESLRAGPEEETTQE